MKITTKTTKEQLKSFLGANAKAVKTADKDLFDQIAYADKMAKKDDSKVTRKDLVDLVKSVISLLGDKCVEPALAQEKAPATPQAENSVKKLAKGVSKKQEKAPATPQAENSVKKLAKGVSKKQETKEETSSEESGESENTAEETQGADEKKAPKKSLGGKKKPATKKEGVTVLNTDADSEKAVQLAKAFPKTLEVGDSKYELAEDIKTLDDLYEALNKDEEIVFAYYWTKRHLKQFSYFGGWLGQPKSFDNDLDLATAIYVSDEKKVSYQVSMYTEAIYTILPTDFEETDGVRVAGGIEYQIYRAV